MIPIGHGLVQKEILSQRRVKLYSPLQVTLVVMLFTHFLPFEVSLPLIIQNNPFISLKVTYIKSCINDNIAAYHLRPCNDPVMVNVMSSAE